MSNRALTVTAEQEQGFFDLIGGDWITTQLNEYETFRRHNSPKDFWSHRPPRTSPIVPLLHVRGLQQTSEEPLLGHWYGNPHQILSEIIAGIFIFEGYWSRLPAERGKGNIRFSLQNRGRFASFTHELRVASHYETRTPYRVEPLFLDPQSARGDPDIRLHNDNGHSLGIQCKIRDPIEALEMPFDLFQYLFGVLARQVEDCDDSWEIRLHASHRLDQTDADRILEHSKQIIRSRLEVPSPYTTPNWELSAHRVSLSHAGITTAEIYQRLDAAQGNLYVEIAGFKRAAHSPRWRNFLICSVSGTHPEDAPQFVSKRVQEAISNVDPRSDTASAVAVHLYTPVDFHSHLANNFLKSLAHSLKPIFSTHRHLHSVDVSSNSQRYVIDQESGRRLIATPRAIVINPSYDATLGAFDLT